jgi:wyosine [tRNA(Phe)-imidazoG37] synthetase (radical SAM superfamily)
MIANGIRYSYGPVPSRRLGRSLGINNIPAKRCTYSCIYCQVGRTKQIQKDRRFFYEPEDIVRDVQCRLTRVKEAGEPVDFFTFVPDGEPTLDVNLGREITSLKALGIPVGVITNSSLLWLDDVKEELCKADWVSLKLDAVREGVWKKINRPNKAIRLSQVLSGVLEFARAFTGQLVTETMLVRELNDDAECMGKVADFLHRLQPSQAYLSVPTRPPAVKSVSGPDEVTLNRMYQILAGKVRQVEYLTGYEGDAFAFTGNMEQDLLKITAVHPMREEAVSQYLSQAGASWDVIDRLVAQGSLAATKYDGHIFYLRKFTEGQGATA